MKFFLLLLASLTTNQASAAILTFDDIPGGSIPYMNAQMPTYKGFNFSDRLFWSDAENGPFSFGAYSGNFVLQNNPKNIEKISQENGSDFTFAGFWAKVAAPKGMVVPPVFGGLEGYNDGVLAWSAEINLNQNYQYFDAQSGAIDELRLDFNSFIVIDNLSLNAVSPVPEPSSLALLALGLLGVVSFSRQSRAKKILVSKSMSVG